MRLRKKMASDMTSESTLFEKMKQIHNTELEKLNQDAVTQHDDGSFTIESKLESGEVILTELMHDGTILCSLFSDVWNPVILNEVNISK